MLSLHFHSHPGVCASGGLGSVAVDVLAQWQLSVCASGGIGSVAVMWPRCLDTQHGDVVLLSASGYSACFY